MNRKQTRFLAAIAVASLLMGSGLVWDAFESNAEDDGRIKVVATFYPLAFMAKEIGGELVSVRTLIPENTEVHAWEPSTSAILMTDDADVLLYNGAGLEPWFENDILPVISKGDKLVVRTTSGLDLLPAGEDNHDENDLYDPHAWVCPFTAIQQADRICRALVETDPNNESYFSERYEMLAAQLESLNLEYTNTLSNKSRSCIFVSHSAYGYLADRYGFEQHGIIGLSGDEEPSTATIASLVDLMEMYETYFIYVDPMYREDYAETLRSTLRDETGNEVMILSLYLMLGTADGLGFIEQMEANLGNLAIGLGAT